LSHNRQSVFTVPQETTHCTNLVVKRRPSLPLLSG
jgi:hypothetical protein